MAIDLGANKTVFSTPSGNIASTITEAGSQSLTLSSNDGSNIIWTDGIKSELNSGNNQKLTLKDEFSTTYGNSSEYTKKTKECRIEGDIITFVGNSEILHQDLMGQWYKVYQQYIGTIKEQWQSEVTTSTNTFYNKPIGSDNITVAPDLIDASAEDNKDDESKANFRAKMNKSGTEKTKALQEKLNQTYSDKNATLLSRYNSMKYTV